ncbi:hypothetical protein R0K18_15065 [Pantoea sp. SIMBA_133]
MNDHEQATALFADDGIIKLFLREHHRYGRFSMNRGPVKASTTLMMSALCRAARTGRFSPAAV